jgi:ribonuclease D
MSKLIINKSLDAAEHPILLETAAQLEDAAKSWERSTILGIDTEFFRERTYRADLGLVQISDGNTAWLLDPLAITSFGPLRQMFENPAIVKLLHSGSEDLEVLHNTVGAIPQPLVDTQIACAFQGQSLQLGYNHALKWLFDVEIDKDQTRSNWLRRPLNQRQLHYAAMDVVLLPEMWLRLQSQLEATGRLTWLQEDVARMQTNAMTPVDAEWVYTRFSGLGRMDQGTLQALKYLARWREGVARTKNRARGFVISDVALLRIARANPSTRDQLAQIEDIHPVALSRYELAILQLIEDAANDPSPVEKFDQLNERQRRALSQMRSLVESRAKELAIEPALLASRKELEKLVRALAIQDPLPERFLGWRKEVITDALIAAAD